jgi:hypothetical protein
MQHRVFLGIYPQKCQIKKRALNKQPVLSTLHRENLSLAGCSAAEPASVSVQRVQNSNMFSIFTNCQKSLPFTINYWFYFDAF